jgi:hypothetical protein
VTRYVEVIPGDLHDGYCSLCGSEMEPFVGWEPSSGWVMLWWTCENNPEHLSNPLPFPRTALEEVLRVRV